MEEGKRAFQKTLQTLFRGQPDDSSLYRLASLLLRSPSRSRHELVYVPHVRREPWQCRVESQMGILNLETSYSWYLRLN